MKECFRCGTPWRGHGAEPRTREVCEGCRRVLRCCVNCHNFDHATTHSCTLPTTLFIGSRTDLNYCDEFRLRDRRLKENETRRTNAKSQWEALFR